MSFREDDRRNRIGHATKNLSRINRLTLKLLRNEKSYKGTVPSKRYKACLQHNYLLKVLGAANKMRWPWPPTPSKIAIL